MGELLHCEAFRRMLECPVCLELPLPPIYVCVKGHIVCNACRAQTRQCPLCRDAYSNVRNFIAENIIERCNMQCKHADQGCPLTLRGAELVEHLKICDYRPVKCSECVQNLVNYNEYEDHLLKFHRIGLNAGTYKDGVYAYSIQMQTDQQLPPMFEKQIFLKTFNNVSFLLHFYKKEMTIGAWVSLLAPKSECTKYNVYLECYQSKDDSIIHTWEGPANHFRADSIQDIHQHGKGIILALTLPFHWHYYIEISPVNLVLEQSSKTMASSSTPAFIVVPGVTSQASQPSKSSMTPDFSEKLH